MFIIWPPFHSGCSCKGPQVGMLRHGGIPHQPHLISRRTNSESRRVNPIGNPAFPISITNTGVENEAGVTSDAKIQNPPSECISIGYFGRHLRLRNSEVSICFQCHEHGRQPLRPDLQTANPKVSKNWFSFFRAEPKNNRLLEVHFGGEIAAGGPFSAWGCVFRYCLGWARARGNIGAGGCPQTPFEWDLACFWMIFQLF